MLQKQLNLASVLYTNFITVRQPLPLIINEISFGSANPGHRTPYMTRNEFFLHIVIGGEALYDEHVIKAGDVFIMHPLRPHRIQVRADVPFEQYWIEFTGSTAQLLVNSTALSDEDILHIDISHLFGFLHDGVFGECHESLLPMKIAGLLQLTLAALPVSDTNSATGSPTALYVRRATDFLQRNLAFDISITDAANAVGLSEKYLCKLFRKELDITPIQYLRKCRLYHAELLLSTTDLSISDIARDTGFNDPSYFTRFFCNLKGCSPSAYREKS